MVELPNINWLEKNLHILHLVFAIFLCTSFKEDNEDVFCLAWEKGSVSFVYKKTKLRGRNSSPITFLSPISSSWCCKTNCMHMVPIIAKHIKKKKKKKEDKPWHESSIPRLDRTCRKIISEQYFPQNDYDCKCMIHWKWLGCSISTSLVPPHEVNKSIAQLILSWQPKPGFKNKKVWTDSWSCPWMNTSIGGVWVWRKYSLLKGFSLVTDHMNVLHVSF